MSHENIEVVRQVFDRIARGEAALDLLDRDVVWKVHFPPEEGTYRGLAEVDRLYRRWLGVWEDWSVRVEKERALPDGRILITSREAGRGRGSGVSVEFGVCQIWTIREGLVVHCEVFRDEAAALEAAGIQD